MNKTTSINLGGAFFHIDEEAYNKLRNYFEAVKRSLDPVGRDEIINDIEVRIAELFQEKLGTKQVISIIEVDAVISVMGQPEDYKIEDTEYQEAKKDFFNTGNNYANSKKLFRDRENAKVGGVMAGLAHYLNVDALWLRIIIILLVFAGFGTGIIIYIVLWALIPEATSTSQKLEMKGQPITISNIEKKVKEGFNSFSESINNIDTDKITENVKQTSGQVANTLGDVISTLAKTFVKVIGIFFVFMASIFFIGLVVCVIAFFFSSFLPESLTRGVIHTPLGFDIPHWFQGLLLLTLVGIPLFAFIQFSLKLIFSNSKPMGQNTKYVLISTWVLALITSIFVGVSYADKISHNGKITKREVISILPTDTLKVSFVKSDYYSKDNNSDFYDDEYNITQDSLNNDIFISNNINLILKTTTNTKPYIIVEKYAKGTSNEDATKRAEKIEYGYKIINNQIFLNNYLISNAKESLRGQKVNVYLYLPNGVVYQPLGNTKNFTSFSRSDFDYFENNENNVYKVKNNQIECLNCNYNENNDFNIDEEEDENDNDEDVTIKVNGKDLFKTTTTKKDSTERVSIELNGKELINTETKKVKR